MLATTISQITTIMITTTETWVAMFGSVTLPLGHSKNETRISIIVSEIFDRKQEN